MKLNAGIFKDKDLKEGATFADLARHGIANTDGHDEVFKAALKAAKHPEKEEKKEGAGASETPFDIHITNIKNIPTNLTPDKTDTALETILQQIKTTKVGDATGIEAVKLAGKEKELIGVLENIRKSLSDTKKKEAQSVIDQLRPTS